ncbi:Bis(5'-nucleosyl)-tetraphosphatase, symmetrical [Candidatus Profftia lariciata]|uniref:bis(5'-nucleosyl)-tetraphosphatase (symmetrical) ApaH n=1 Tax=Candidatus Profftia lariciata TaxID=1987921 RepID=UPI001D035715|nr:bis(5'-nucleosyl)-tetraphosphatase (symmetrical) ApaH [Candidatus Profftia lariciata]UDG81357.1 Bis(5'-nucleosyl)-tetraphosphatase, symmetrical [Candidatus Profftia lariciata]
MSILLIGDIHGCYKELRSLLIQVAFNPLKDTLWITGDLVGRGPNSVEVLRYIKSLGHSVRMVLGNHDLHLLAIYKGIKDNDPKYNINQLLIAPDVDILINWLRCQPMLQIDNKYKIVMTHAGISPQWNIEIAQMCANEIEAILSSNNYQLLLNNMYNNKSNNWSNNLTYLDRLRFAINALTHMRYCFPNGQLDMICKDVPEKTPAPLKPWFSLPNKVLDNQYAIIFGHWASLAGTKTPSLIYALDTGCCWGGNLTLLRWEDKQYFTQPCF